jgi:hypothetical protein
MAHSRLSTCAGLLAVALLHGLGPARASTQQEEAPRPPEPGNRLLELAGRFEVEKSDPGGEAVVPAELLRLTLGAEVSIRGNELRSGKELLATLTTDFSANRLDLDQAVHVTRHPVMLTLPSGKGLLCAYETYPGNEGVLLVHPHTMGRVSAGTWLYLKRLGK